ncbi:sensor histidine kinase [Terrisporobacter hibernicus]|uniref:histidine kinase n=1 Tax=Terrisporobacter hibernicus TaxID=2813371 RepID=A0AAX2ZKR8_9FIRM|nr:HAMP domain-containing sensor histidine kinase [Terrisporobacter hibernicus]UEL49002.1 HAMP domain-containing histidine kinase [Terrisporobacter hibernicus]
MFKKLKSRFILINMTLLTVVFISIFGFLYFMTNHIINRETNMTIDSLMNNSPKQKPNNGNIIVELDVSGNIINYFVHLNYDMTATKLQNCINSIYKNDKGSGKTKIDDYTYKYEKRSFGSHSKIVLLNISSEDSLKIRLIQIFILAGSISLVILLIISIFLTNKSIEPIKETFNKQKQFIADASHELKTPLSIIKTNTSLLMSYPEDTIKNQSKWIKYIDSQSDRMSDLINEMLSLAKLDVEENKLIVSNMNLSDIINSMLLTFDAVIFESKITLETNISKNITINGNSDSMKKLFSILMDNAVKYTNKCGSISVALVRDKNKAKLIIKNTGDGIPKDKLNKIFERFYRVDDSRDRETGGYGLGLSIARSIVDQHKGKIYATSNFNKDATFTVELPLFL